VSQPRGERVLAGYGPLLLAVGFISVGSVLVRAAQAPPLAVSFYRIALAALALAPFAFPALRRSWPGLVRRDRWLLLFSGVALAVHFATWIASLSYTTVAASVLLVNLAPLSTLALSHLVLHEPVTPVVLGAAALAMGGAVLIAVGDWTGSLGSLRGDLLALAGAVTLSIYHVIGRRLRHALPLSSYVFGVWAAAAVTLWLLTLGAGVPLLRYPRRTFLALFALALVPTLFGHGLVNRSLRVLPAPTVGLFLLAEPIGAAGLAYLLLGEAPGPWTLGGGAVVLLALCLVAWSGRP
jgi:drug/metabolite transporter (DMT)-like permease